MHFRRHLLLFVCSVAASSTLATIVAHVAAQPALINPALVSNSITPEAPPANTTPAAAAPTAPTLADKRAENAEQLRIAMRKLDANGASDTATAQEVAFFQTRDAVLAQQDAVEQQIKDLESRKADTEARSKNPPSTDKQYKFADLDRMKDDLAAEQARSRMISDKIATAQSNLEKAKATLAEAEAKRRQAEENYENGKNASNAVELAAAAERARHDAALANETLTLRKREIEREELTRQLSELFLKWRQQQVARIAPQVKLTEADYKEQLDNIKKSEDTATTTLTRAQSDWQLSASDLKDAQQKLEAAVGEREKDRPVLLEAMIAQRRTRERLTETIEAQTQRLQLLGQLRLAWSRRYQVATLDQNKTDNETWAQLKTAQRETRDAIEQLTAALRIQILKMSDVRSTLSSATKKVDASKGPPELVLQLNIQQKQLEDTLKLYEKNLVTIENSRRVHEKLLDELSPIVEAITPTTIALGVWYEAKLVWDRELISIGNQSVTLGKLVQALAILISGWMIARFTSGMFANRLLRRFRLSKDANSAIRSLVYYSLLFFVVMTALKRVNVDLTAFTILGGALAIGVGFGSQTLINNFVGGLIMLAERPVRLGERVTFKDMDGVVEEVGFRCTKLRTPNDHLVTIPNSTLVNESIENIDRRRTLRRAFTLAITYNISRELLAEGVQAIRDILDERDIRERIHPIIGFEELRPKVHFSEFAAESLNVQITYHYAPVDSSGFAEHTERVNFRIMEEFDRLGIDFAFPSKTAFVKNPNRQIGRSRGGDSYAA